MASAGKPVFSPMPGSSARVRMLHHPVAKAAGLVPFFVNTLAFRRHVPLIASFKLTYRCNLSCLGCPFHRRAAAVPTLSWEAAVRALDELKNMGCRIVVFEGGEPLLWRDGEKDFSDLANYARRNFICSGATTNGTVSLDVPTDVLWISIDGLKDTHDELRSSSWDAAMENIRSSTHPKLFVHYTLNSRNFRDFSSAAVLFLSIKQIKGITVQLFYPYGQGEEDLRLSPGEREEALSSVLDLKRSGFPIMNSEWGIKAMIRNTWRCREWLLANVEPDGSITEGCYVKYRGRIICRECGFTPVSEASGALDLRPGSLRAGWRLFVS